MHRRELLKSTGLAAASVGLASLTTSQLQAQQPSAKAAGSEATMKNNFNLKYAPHPGQFKHSAGDDYLAQLRYAADLGFTAWEDNGMKKRSVEVQEQAAKIMQDNGMTMGVFVAHGDFNAVSFTGTNKGEREKVLKDIRDSIEVAKRVNAKWMTVVTDKVNIRLEPGYQTAHCVDLLRQCCEILEPHNLVMVLEPLNWWANHPGLFLNKIPQAYEICRAVDSPSCKILFDIYHQQIQEGNLIPNIDMAWSEIGYFQCGDNPGRKEPGTGEIHYRNVFRHIHNKGFEGVMGMEHGNSKPGAEGEKALVEAYVKADDF
ncbi:MAG: TIM barrel protein [Lacipirellulaceae bacterium]